VFVRKGGKRPKKQTRTKDRQKTIKQKKTCKNENKHNKNNKNIIIIIINLPWIIVLETCPTQTAP